MVQTKQQAVASTASTEAMTASHIYCNLNRFHFDSVAHISSKEYEMNKNEEKKKSRKTLSIHVSFEFQIR